MNSVFFILRSATTHACTEGRGDKSTLFSSVCRSVFATLFCMPAFAQFPVTFSKCPSFQSTLSPACSSRGLKVQSFCTGWGPPSPPSSALHHRYSNLRVGQSIYGCIMSSCTCSASYRSSCTYTVALLYSHVHRSLVQAHFII